MQLDDNFDNIIHEYRLIGFDEDTINSIIAHSVRYYKHINMPVINAVLYDRTFLVDQLNSGVSREDAVAALFKARPVLYN